jgi:RimJ/RimL family protein N-acetyltransferase
MPPVPAVVLEGRHVQLAPLALTHLDALVAAASGPRETFALTFVPHGPDDVRAYIAAALDAQAAGTALPFVITSRALGRIVGSTRFGLIEYWPWPPGHAMQRPAGCPDAAEIGWTWLSEDAQRTAINTECKRLMLAYAFEVWRLHRVTLITDARNARSRAAIERLGAGFEGIQRAHFPAGDGTIRDSATYSILAAEWPMVRDRLDTFLARGPSETGRNTQ